MIPSGKYRYLSLERDSERILALLPQVAALARGYALQSEPAQVHVSGKMGLGLSLAPRLEMGGFLGCPLSESELRERMRFVDSFHIAVSEDSLSELAGYCYGYSARAVRGLLADVSTAHWEERELYEHGMEVARDFSVNFQVAVDSRHVGHGLGTRLAGAVTQEVGEGNTTPCLLWVLLYPFNRLGFRVAAKCGFRLARTFPSAIHESFLWGELELQRGNGY